MSKTIKASQNSRVKSTGPGGIIAFGALLVTLYFNTKIQDPFNSPKMWLLILLAAWLAGYLITNLRKINSEKNLKFYSVILIFFVASILFASMVSDNKYFAFFGETQRRNGFITYLSLSIIGLAAATYVRIENIKKFYVSAFLTGTILAVYGLLQNSGVDFVKWNNPYNSIISTVGNPNFAAAIMAMMATITFGPVLNKSFKIHYRIFGLIITFVLLITIYLSEARQGLISFMVGIGIYLIIWLFQIKRSLGIASAFSGVAIGLLSILGMLQIGPLTSFLYKGSVTVRGYYWKAGIKMFTENPLTGVGFDRYGAFFKEYRDVGYPLKYGFNITSSNAHNLPIQLLATGGIFVGISYILLNLFILFVGIKSIRTTKGTDQLLISSIFTSWLAYQAQSIISIDNIGISIWGWVLGGLIIGLSIKLKTGTEQNVQTRAKKNNQSLTQPIFSMAFVIISILLISNLYKVEVNMFDTRARFNPQSVQLKPQFYQYAQKTLGTKLLDLNYKLNIGVYMIENGYTDEGIKVLKEVRTSDPRNLDALFYLAEYNQKMNNFNDAINYRLAIEKLDPWNSYNYLQLGRIYKSNGDLNAMKAILIKIQSYDMVSPESKTAAAELVNS